MIDGWRLWLAKLEPMTDAPWHPARALARTSPSPNVELATREVPRRDVRLLAIDPTCDRLALHRFAELPSLLRAGDVVVVNDAATLPGSLRGRGERGGIALGDIELRLSAPIDGDRLYGVLLGAGDWRTPTEHRVSPPAVAIDDRLVFGDLATRVIDVDGRRVAAIAECTGDVLWRALYAAGAPVQYAHRPERLPLYELQTAYAARPWAAEMPSAGRPLTWEVLLGLRRAGIEIATLTHAAGLSSTGDATLDRAMPWPEHYEIPRRTAAAIVRARREGGRVIAIGTTVVRALEASGGAPGPGIATLKLTEAYRPDVVDGLVSGLHVPGESHFELLRAFASRHRLERALALARARGLSSHELGDTCLILPR